MKISILPNGNLKMECGPVEQKSLKRRGRIENWFNETTSERWFIENFLEPEGFEDLEGKVALCSAPVIGKDGEVWGFMNYCVEAFLETLASGKPVIWTKG